METRLIEGVFCVSLFSNKVFTILRSEIATEPVAEASKSGETDR